jgi:hypothetical protein
MKSKIIIPITLALVLLANSCDNFLDEVNKTGKTEDLVYSTESSLDGLVASCYSYLRLWYGKEAGFGLSEAGTDLWYNARDNKQLDLVTYQNVSPEIASDPTNNNSCFDEYWEAFYSAINLCNTALKNLETAKTNGIINNEEKRQALIGEVLFLRAFYHWHMVEIWGPVQLNTTQVNSPSTTPTRNSIDEIYGQMFIDVDSAISKLGSKQQSKVASPSSRASYWAARALKARLALYYASEYGKTDYFSIAAAEANDVITSSGKQLYQNYEDVWLIQNSTTKSNNEFLWAVDYYNTIGGSESYNFLPTRITKDNQGNIKQWSAPIARRQPTDGSGSGNIQHLLVTPLWNSQTDNSGGASLGDVLTRVVGPSNYYTVASPATKVSVDVGYFYAKYAMGYCRYAPTLYCLGLFDETKDERFNGTFRTAWYKHSGVVPRNYGQAYPTCPYPNMVDTALYISKRPLTASQIAWATGRYKIFDVSWIFQADSTPDINRPASSNGNTLYPMLRKFENTDSKIANSTNFNDYFSYRDFPIFRISEMYLIAAEALLQSNQAQSINLINTLRSARAFSGQDMSVSSVDLDFILEERAREFAGENIRWFDLKRTKKLEIQIKHNKRAKPYFDASKHYLRPIPNTQMKAVTNLTTGPTEGGFWQNPGY